MINLSGRFTPFLSRCNCMTRTQLHPKKHSLKSRILNKTVLIASRKHQYSYFDWMCKWAGSQYLLLMHRYGNGWKHRVLTYQQGEVFDCCNGFLAKDQLHSSHQWSMKANINIHMFFNVSEIEFIKWFRPHNTHDMIFTDKMSSKPSDNFN